MQDLRIEEEQNHAWTAGTALPVGLNVESEITPEEEDARRRFILALRAMTARKQREERDAAAMRQWMRTLEADVAAYKRARQKKQRRRLLFFAAIALLIFGANIPELGELRNYWWLLLMLGAGGTAAAQAFDSARSKQMAAHLATARDPRAVSVLAIAARDGDAETRKAAEVGLVSILPQLQASDSEFINEQGMAALLHLLGHSPKPKLQIAILRGLEQVGDERAMSLVSMLAETPVDSEVAEAARNCRRFLRSRAEQARLRQVLLRPASHSTEPDRTLLRPAGSTETPSEQLLRPAD